ncbi:ABC transporter substrate-binding protein [Dethiosulfovibrio salsuginis]|nr:ABC transporter substrate-binding protein [Dethiosulfovibrio salsuginis]
MSLQGCAFGDSVARGLKEGWVWPVLVLSPSDGWSGPSGQSISPVVSYSQSQINDSVQGIRGRDILFELKKDDIGDPVASWRDWSRSGYRAVLSFAGPSTNGALVEAWRPGYPPLLLADDSDTSIRSSSGGVQDGVFALQLHKSFITRASVEMSSSVLPPASEVALFSDMLTPYLSRGARATAEGLSKKGMDPEIFWIAGGGQDSYNMVIQEMLGFGADMMVIWMDDMSTREMYRQLRNVNRTIPVWSAGAARSGVVLLDGIFSVDQDWPVLKQDRDLRRLKTDVWDSTRVRVGDSLLAAKAYAACRWIIGALEGSDDDGTVSLIVKSMANVKGIPLAGQALDVSPVTHRPASRAISIMRAKGGVWIEEGSIELSESGPGYFFDTPVDR